mmetsp:Transcript_7773/g.22879  ORF Transcript_7773/g.22879 Transcript_7773/m.22879 type:complete len:99 (+) Transcript_7773:317-613(+)
MSRRECGQGDESDGAESHDDLDLDSNLDLGGGRYKDTTTDDSTTKDEMAFFYFLLSFFLRPTEPKFLFSLFFLSDRSAGQSSLHSYERKGAGSRSGTS